MRVRRGGSRQPWLWALPLLGACSAGGKALPAPNLLLVVVDCLRADHLGVYGYERPTSPELDALAAQGVTFRDAYAQAFWTRPSVPTLLTGLYPSEHGLLAWEKDEQGKIVGPALSPAVETLAERLRSAGYRTALLAEQVQLSRRFALDQGFDLYDADGGEAANVNRALGRFLDGARGDRPPFFAYLHYLEVHWPYCPPRGPRGRFDPGTSDIDFCYGWRELRQRILDGEVVLDAGDRAAMVARYDEEILGVDWWLGRLFEDLARRGLWDETLVIVTADHGEEFFEHGKIGHENDLWDELLHVPLIVKPPAAWPGARGTTVDALVETRQVAATLLEAAGASPTSEGSLVAWLTGGEAEARGYVVAESRAAVAVRTDEAKLLVRRQGGDVELYDLRSDPGEQRDVAAERPADVARLRALLAAWRRELEIVPPQARELDAAAREGLATLGYLDN
jgi:arylsulfatase A-like enzyme